MSTFLVILSAIAGSGGHIYCLYTNDIEGGLSPSTAWWMNPYFPPPLGNAAAAATYIADQRRAAQENGYGFLLFDTGDAFMGNPIGEFSDGLAVADYFNACGYDVLSPGNHDYDRGVETFRNFVAHVEADVLGSNIVYEDTRAPVDYLRQYVIREVMGVRIGMFSVLTEYMEGMTTPERFKNHDVLPEIETARRFVDTLRAHDVDLVFMLSGAGLRHDKRVAEQVPGIDVIFGSHSATALEEPYEDSINHTIIVQSYGHLTSIGFLDLQIDTRTRRIAGYHGELVDLFSEDLAEDTAMLALVQKWDQVTQKGFDEVIGYSQEELSRTGFEESTMGNLITDAMREYFNVDVAIHNAGGIRANLPKGEVTFRDCYKIDALSNTAVTMRVTGRELREILEVGVNGHHAIFQVSGLRMVYDTKRPPMDRVVSVTLGEGVPLDSAAEYSLVTNSFLAAGGGDYIVFKKGRDAEDTMTYLRNVIAEYIHRHSPVSVRLDGRIRDVARQ